MPPSARDMLRPLVEDLHEDVVRGHDAGNATELAERLPEAGFPSPGSAAHFGALCAILFGAQIDDDTVLDLFEACLLSPSPDAALLNLHRYLDNAGGVSVFTGAIVGSPPLLDMVTTVFGASQYMSDIIIRSPSP